MSKKQWGYALILAFVFVMLGAIREMVFVNINEQMYFNDGLIDRYRVLDLFKFLGDYTNTQLNTLKWGLTIGFSLAYLSLSAVALRYALNDRKGFQWLIYAYLGVFGLAGLAYLGGYLMSRPDLGYTLSRRFMGALQSPFILMLMIPARMLANQKGSD